MYSDNDYAADVSSERRFSKKRKNRTRDFSETDKRKLAALIKKNELLWDCTNLLHSNAAALDKTWTEIGTQMGKPKDKCKLAWTALRESYRYHARAAKISDDPLEQNKNAWPYFKDLSFLAKAKRVSKTIYPYIETSNDDATDLKAEQDDTSMQNYDIKDENGGSSELDNYEANEQETTDYDEGNEKQNTAVNISELGSLVKQLGKLINAQTQFVQQIRGSGSGADLVYQTQLSACDALLQQLPQKIAKTTLVEIQNYILKKINDQQKLRTDMDL